MSVLSFDGDKVLIDEKNNIVNKCSSCLEHRQIVLAADYLISNPITLTCGLHVKVSGVLGFQDNQLSLKFCLGLNLEDALKYNIKRKLWLEVFRELLNTFQRRGFFWGDLAPRNMIFDKTTTTLHIFDFEKKLIIEDCSSNNNLFSKFFRRYAYEEFSCFLSFSERINLFQRYLIENQEGEVFASEIFSTRKKNLLSECFGNKSVYSIKEVNIAEDLMSFVATPIILRNRTFYPMFEIEKIIRKGGYHAYSEIIKRSINCRSEGERFCVIKEINERLFVNS